LSRSYALARLGGMLWSTLHGINLYGSKRGLFDSRMHSGRFAYSSNDRMLSSSSSFRPLLNLTRFGVSGSELLMIITSPSRSYAGPFVVSKTRDSSEPAPDAHAL